ncbi:MAG: segregation/condensation protein A, partial [Nanoarchaeota archaeon]|nr:segregation/condensation protein A [Nanoarchaeota archaeon]
MDKIPEKRGTNEIKQEKIHNILFNREIGWQEIIYDLINTEQLDPWDINITILTDKYLEKVREFEEADFFVSGKVLLAATFLLRIKSEILLDKYIRSIDEILFGTKEEKPKVIERMELDETIPELIPKSPMPRMKKVTLNQLMEALGKAIATENRRIKKEVINRNVLRESSFSMPKKKKNIEERVTEVYNRLKIYFTGNKEEKRVSFLRMSENKREEKINMFPNLIHLDHQKK